MSCENQEPPKKRCTYVGCTRPGESPQYYRIENGRTSGAQDWSSLEGSVLCNACFLRFSRKGTLERCTNNKLPLHFKRCMYADCDSPDESIKFFRIEEGMTAGGQDWNSLAGSVLCNACYKRFKHNGTLERSRNKPLAACARRCTNPDCDRPGESRQFLEIGEDTTAGGQNWSSLVGSVLCISCYGMFSRRGTLDRVYKKQHTECAQRCSYSGCGKPDESSHFYCVEEGTTAGGKDWSLLVGSVLCAVCYNRFRCTGTLERGKKRKEVDSRLCTYAGCSKPDESSYFYRITPKIKAGGRDWSSLAGSVLCNTCYTRFKRSGKLERSSDHPLEDQRT